PVHGRHPRHDLRCARQRRRPRLRGSGALRQGERPPGRGGAASDRHEVEGIEPPVVLIGSGSLPFPAGCHPDPRPRTPTRLARLRPALPALCLTLVVLAGCGSSSSSFPSLGSSTTGDSGWAPFSGNTYGPGATLAEVTATATNPGRIRLEVTASPDLVTTT